MSQRTLRVKGRHLRALEPVAIIVVAPSNMPDAFALRQNRVFSFFKVDSIATCNTMPYDVYHTIGRDIDLTKSTAMWFRMVSR